MKKSKKKIDQLDGEGRETTGQKDQRDLIYKQNEEQSESTIWKRLKEKND